jgi:hypothetical protein
MNRRDFISGGLGFSFLLGSKNTIANYLTTYTDNKMQKMNCIFLFDVSIDANQFTAHCREWGINVAVLHPGFFKDSRMTDALRKNGIKLWLNFPVFYNPDFLKENPDYYSITNKGRKAIHDWCHFVCPNRTDYIEHLINDAAVLAKKLQPPVMSLDFIRNFVFWELVDLNGNAGVIEDGCYCSVCLTAFSKSSQLNIPSTSPAEFIRTRAKHEWARWKTKRITDTANRFVNNLRSANPEAEIWIKTVPWKQSDLDGAIINSAGQDIPALGSLVDGIAPMAFTHILRQTPAWKETLLREVKTISGKPVISYVQVDKVYRDKEISLQQFESELKTGYESDSAGVLIFCYEQLIQSPEKIEILKKHLHTENSEYKSSPGTSA